MWVERTPPRGQGSTTPAPLMTFKKPLTITGDACTNVNIGLDAARPMGATQGEGWDNPRPPVVGNGSACSNVDVDLDRYEGEEWANPRPTMIINSIAYTDLHDLELENDDVYVDATFQDDHESERPTMIINGIAYTDLHELELENDDVYGDATFQDDHESEQARSVCSPLSWQGCTNTPPPVDQYDCAPSDFGSNSVQMWGDDLSQNGPEGNPPNWEIDYAPAKSSPPQ